MNGLLHKQHQVFGNMIHVVGLCLCLYFFYHVSAGNRSVFELVTTQASIATMSLKVDSAVADRMALQQKVMAMRPGSVDRDLLEERAREVLGYQGSSDILLLGH